MYAHVYEYFNTFKIIYRNKLYMCNVYDNIFLILKLQQLNKTHNLFLLLNGLINNVGTGQIIPYIQWAL